MSIFQKETTNGGLTRIYRLFGMKLWQVTSKRCMRAHIVKLEQEVHCLYSFLNMALDIRNCPPAHGALRQTQEQCLALLRRVAAALERHQLAYWLDFGTLLGAVRHKGFIPWDDDIDICMVRPDYDKALRVLQEEFADGEFELREASAAGSYCQLRINRKSDSVGLDIFPVDEYAGDIHNEEERQQLVSKTRQARAELASYLQKHPQADLRKAVADITREMILDGRDATPGGPVLFYAIDFPHPQDQVVLRRDELFPLGRIAFEGVEFPCPKNAEKFLTMRYGDWMAWPRYIAVHDASH